MSGSTTGDLAAQLAAIDADLFVTHISAARTSIGSAAATTLLQTQPETLELAQAATAPLVQQAVSAVPLQVQPVLQQFAAAYVPAITEGLYNYIVGQLGGTVAKQEAVAAENNQDPPVSSGSGS